MKSGTEENTMDFGNMMKLMGAWNTFKRNHPKFPAFCRAVHAKGLREDSVVEIIVTTPEGERIIDQDAGIRVFGHASRQSYRKSLKLYARDEYGKAEFDYPLFSDKKRDFYCIKKMQ